MIWAILATGPSMNQEIADYVKGKCKVIAVSNAYKLAPWADCLVSHDRNWWRFHKDALDFKGDKYCHLSLGGVKTYAPHFMPKGSNSGLMAMYLAESLGATKILLLGFDMHGTHYFGKHPEPLKNTDDKAYKRFIKQFEQWKGCEVINCTKGSSLKSFKFSDIKAII